ncbi:hypothetical protein ALC60_13158 [Trachymyrmex zeteki]|uniref:NAD(P)H-hydrate epimerase n=1 Tax=Mycetomoellerius zeteki TaxID=64791 RepID=A0A151WIW4_9HYME|nr:PREDICTED: NAD(P)H-hydrate epimerase [Trachymyrmex zeteki]KYQ47813.1 hypothetical protein ALC60_13158 [Trachymyrmex zeteki]
MLQLVSSTLTSQSVKRIKVCRSVIDISSFVPFARRKYNKMVKYLNQSEAINIDKDLFEKYKFSVDQLMELAGQSCAVAIAKSYPLSSSDAEDSSSSGSSRVLICCGPGNNGGDGMVCARHLKLFGYSPEIYYPKRTNNELYQRLLHQCVENGVLILENQRIEEATADSTILHKYAIVVDALLGFNFRPPVREPFVRIIDMLKNTSVPICSVDIPSGWDVERGPPEDGGIRPQMLISLTAPKMCASKFDGKFHYLGGRFVPKKLESQYNLNLPKYAGTDLVVRLH